jgi:hypothetical protein
MRGPLPVCYVSHTLGASTMDASQPTSSPLNHGILHRYYTSIKPLEEYIHAVLGTELPLAQSSDGRQFLELLSKTLVASQVPQPPKLKFRPPMISQTEVVDLQPPLWI